MKEIIEDIISEYGLDSSDVCSITIRKGGTRSDNVIVHRMHSGNISLMAKVEDKLVGLIIRMACIRYSLTLSLSLSLSL